MHFMHRNQFGWRLLAIIGLGLALLILNIDLMIVNLALPMIGKLFHAGLVDLQWINNMYSLAMASSVVFIGALADRYGHRRIFLSGITLFCIGSLIAGFAFSTGSIIVGRFFQGVGMAATLSMIFILATLIFPKNQQGFVLGLLAFFVGIGLAIGPSLGGLMIDAFSWRWAFLINVPICVITYLSIFLACPKDSGKRSTVVHYASAFFLIVICFLIVFALNMSRELSVTVFWVLLVVGLVALGAFLIWQTRLDHPLVDLDVFKTWTYAYASGIRVLFQFTVGAFLFVLPLYLQNIEGFSVGFSGLVILILASTLAIVSPLCGKLNDFIGPGVSIVTSQICAIVGFGVLVWMPFELSWPLIIVSLICVGAYAGITLPSLNYLVIRAIPAEKKGLAFGMFTAQAFFSLSIGIAVTGAVLNHVSARNFYRLLSENQLGERVALSKALPLINGAHSISKLKQLTVDQSDRLVAIGKAAFLAALHALMLGLAILALIGLFLAIFLWRRLHSQTYVKFRKS